MSHGAKFFWWALTAVVCTVTILLAWPHVQDARPSQSYSDGFPAWGWAGVVAFVAGVFAIIYAVVHFWQLVKLVFK